MMIIRRSAALLLYVSGLACVSCVPVVANLSSGDFVPKAVSSRTGLQGTLLVLPLWLEPGEFSFRDPYVIASAAVGTPAARVPRRIGFYFDSLIGCGGPTKSVFGYLVVTETGLIVWSDVRGESVPTDVNGLKAELEALFRGAEAGALLRDLLQAETYPIGFHASQERRDRAIEFLVMAHE